MKFCKHCGERIYFNASQPGSRIWSATTKTGGLDWRCGSDQRAHRPAMAKDIEAAEAADEASYEHFNRYIAGDR